MQADAGDASQVVLNGTLVSRNCGLRVRISAASVQVEKYYSKAVNYTLMMTAVSFFQVNEYLRPCTCGGQEQGCGDSCMRHRSVEVVS